MHPNVLKILEPFHEDSNVLAFVTEPVECTLAQILNQKREVPIRTDLTELKIILMELLEGVSYLNEKTNSAHLNLCPENIFVTPDGKWKIGGFGFLCQSEVGGQFKSDKITLGDSKKGVLNPNPAFSALEVLDNGKE
jgi:SCY1-like protein 2